MCKDPSQTNTGPFRQTKNPSRVTRAPLRPTECSLRQIKGLHELIEALAAGQSAFSVQHGAWSGQQRSFWRHYKVFLSQTQACSSLWPAKGTPRPIQGQLRLTRAPQSSTGLSLANKMPSWAKRGLLRPKEGPLRVAQGTFRPT